MKNERALALNSVLLYSIPSFVVLVILALLGWLPKLTPALADIPGLPTMKHTNYGIAQYFFDLPRLLWFVMIPMLIFAIAYYTDIIRIWWYREKGIKGGAVAGVVGGLVVGSIPWSSPLSFDLTVTWITVWFLASVLTGILCGETTVKTSFFGSSFSVVAGTVSGMVCLFKYLIVLKGLGFFGIIGVIGAGIGLFVAIATLMSVLPMLVAIVERVRSMPFWSRFKKAKTTDVAPT